jgi:hypothetical protein
MNNQLIFQTGFEYVCNQFGLDSVNIFNALGDIHEAGLELNGFSRFSKNLIEYEGFTPTELEFDQLAQFYMTIKVICHLTAYDQTPLGEDCLNALAFEEVTFDSSSCYNSASSDNSNNSKISSGLDDSNNNLEILTGYKLPDNIPEMMDKLSSDEFKAQLLANIQQTEFANRSNLVHWFYYRLTRGVNKN